MWRGRHWDKLDWMNRRYLRAGRLAAVGVLTAALIAAVPAHATFAGGNGRIAYTWSRGGESFESTHPRLVGVVSVRPDGDDRRLVARGATHPRYSPDGRGIAFLRGARLWTARADGKRARAVTPSDWAVGDNDWSPGGTRLALVRTSRNHTWDAVYTVRSDGRGLQRLLKGPWGIRLSPGAWSPDGKAIVYTQERHSGRPMVRVVRAGHVTTLALGSMPTWSRQGVIAYATAGTTSRPGQVCLIRPERVAPFRCFGSADATASDPTWSPDGRRLMLMYTPQAGPAQIWTVLPDGVVLTRAPRGNEFPIFSPDGRWLAFSRARFGGDPRLGYSDLYLMRPNGTEARQLVRGGQAQTPDWQPLTRRRSAR